MSEPRRQWRSGAGVRLDCLEAGPSEGPLVFLLHGFPEEAASWERQIDDLARAGFHVVAPDQRGYGVSGKPRGVAAYRLDVLARDITRLAEGLGRSRYDLVGHDWGGVVAWRVAASRPDQVRRLVVLNAPHPVAMVRYLWRSPSQLLNSAYIAVFQPPRMAEMLLRVGGFAVLVETLRRSSRPGAFSQAAFERLRAGWRRPGAMTAMLNWYRALAAPCPPMGSWAAGVQIACPTLVIWGRGDAFLQSGLARASAEMCENGQVMWMDEATHWLHHEAPARVSQAIRDFLG